MKELRLTIHDINGIHARPAGIFVKQMQGFQSDINVAKMDKQADGKKLFALMKLAVKSGETIIITAKGPDEEAAIEAARSIFKELEL